MPQPTVFPDGRTAFVQSINLTDFAERDCHIKLWKEDVVFVLNQIEKLNQSDKDNRFTGRMDTSRIGMFGHSYGGATVASVSGRLPCQSDHQYGWYIIWGKCSEI